MLDQAVSCFILRFQPSYRVVMAGSITSLHCEIYSFHPQYLAIFSPNVVAPMSSPHKNPLHSTTFWTFSFCSVLVHVLSSNAYPKCNGGLYGSPTYADCHHALSSIPQDTAIHFFVEQQLRTAPPQADWEYFPDLRPLRYQLPHAQTPKWWSRGEP